MSPRTITLVALPTLLLGAGLVGQATWRIHDLDQQSAGLAAAGLEAGNSFVETLQGEHATRLFQTLDRRRAVALARADARRNRLFGLLLVVAGTIGLSAASAFRRIAAEIEEDRGLSSDGPPGPPQAG